MHLSGFKRQETIALKHSQGVYTTTDQVFNHD